MNNLFKISLFILLLTLVANKGFSQTSLAYYNSSDSKIGLAHNFTPKLWGEARLSLTFKDLNTEFVLCYDALKLKDYNFYLGLGAQIRDESGLVIPIGVQVAPFEKFKNLSLQVELLPIFTDYDTMLQSSIGVRYTFGKK
ncbi:hypothetical protein EV201_2186 [Ancylomarina subtilis]|uniref:Outer membrane protein with beta-barrel domain n=1 Tax=Ancylomarina subtilis TaxID=1639035 RepID=A0A4V2FTB3_9BACT|nr:hypothetical protein [Ancylomarina subtilis]RZT97515.1 hypothetical protein EV201_2186 [Ancylomarina subtilis]